MSMQYIQQQNELIKSLRESMKNYEENLDDGIPKEREVSLGLPFCVPRLHTNRYPA